MSNVFYSEIEKYVNDTAATFLEPINNIESLKCARRVDHVYIELVYEDSYVRYFDISSMDVSSVGMMLCHIVANEPISREIKDRLVKKEVRKIFR